METLQPVQEWLAQYPLAETLLGVVLLLLAALVANALTKQVLLRLVRRGLTILPYGENPTLARGVIGRLANIVPTMVIYTGIVAVPHISPAVVTVTRNVCAAFVIITIVMAISSALTLANEVYQKRESAKNRPIKGYLQLVKLVLYGIAAILVIAALIDRSPLLLLSGLGALAAVLMLVFQSTLLSLVASVQIGSDDMVRVGDWIEMPSAGADGDVIDIALHTVKVRNWDMTVTTIPTSRLITESFKNWRGMSDSGGRRIKRSLLIDQNSVRFLSEEELARLHRFALIDEYLDEKAEELAAWNAALEEAGKEPVNHRRITNIGTFRAYVTAYLKAHPRVAQNMIQIVRQLDPTPNGLPLEIYCFTATTAWIPYESIQGDVFDHLIAIMPEFGLRLFQQPTGLDFAQLAEAQAQAQQAQAEAGEGASAQPS